MPDVERRGERIFRDIPEERRGSLREFVEQRGIKVWFRPVKNDSQERCEVWTDEREPEGVRQLLTEELERG